MPPSTRFGADNNFFAEARAVIVAESARKKKKIEDLEEVADDDEEAHAGGYELSSAAHNSSLTFDLDLSSFGRRQRRSRTAMARFGSEEGDEGDDAGAPTTSSYSAAADLGAANDEARVAAPNALGGGSGSRFFNADVKRRRSEKAADATDAANVGGAESKA